jgi:hypothetical protein
MQNVGWRNKPVDTFNAADKNQTKFPRLNINKKQMKKLTKHEQQIYAGNHCGSISCDAGTALYSMGRGIK